MKWSDFTGKRTIGPPAAVQPRYAKQLLILVGIITGLVVGFWLLGWLLSAVLR